MLYPTLWRTSSPFLTDDLFGLGRERNRMFDRFFGETAGLRFGSRSQTDWTPPTDVVETADEYRIGFDLPGLTPDEIEVTLRDNVLSVRGERTLHTGESEGRHTYYCQERRYGRFERHFTLPSVVSAENMKAEYDNGVLTVVLPKEEAAKPRRIEIKGANDQARITSGRSAD